MNLYLRGGEGQISTTLDNVTILALEAEGYNHLGWESFGNYGNWEERIYEPGENLGTGMYGNVNFAALWERTSEFYVLETYWARELAESSQLEMSEISTIQFVQQSSLDSSWQGKIHVGFLLCGICFSLPHIVRRERKRQSASYSVRTVSHWFVTIPFSSNQTPSRFSFHLKSRGFNSARRIMNDSID